MAIDSESEAKIVGMGEVGIATKEIAVVPGVSQQTI